MESRGDMEKQMQDESVWVPQTPAKSTPPMLKFEHILSVERTSSKDLANQHHGASQRYGRVVNENAHKDEAVSFMNSTSTSILNSPGKVIMRTKTIVTQTKCNVSKWWTPKALTVDPSTKILTAKPGTSSKSFGPLRGGGNNSKMLVYQRKSKLEQYEPPFPKEGAEENSDILHRSGKQKQVLVYGRRSCSINRRKFEADISKICKNEKNEMEQTSQEVERKYGFRKSDRMAAIAAACTISNLFKKRRREGKEILTPKGPKISDERGDDINNLLEEQREIMRFRVLDFISLMNKVQGNKRFSEWKGSVLDSVVGTFLTQNTGDHLSSSAFMTLASRFPMVEPTETTDKYSESVNWEAVRQAPPEHIMDAIQIRGNQERLGSRIQKLLNKLVEERGSLDLEWLKNAAPDEAKGFLMSFEGLGLKSAECISLLCLHHHAFPVDVNVARVSVRLGWVPLRPVPNGIKLDLLAKYPESDKIHEYLWERLDKLDLEILYELHYQMITFGKVFCTEISPSCGTCPMKKECRRYKCGVDSSTLSQLGVEEESTSSTIFSVPDIDDSMLKATSTKSFPPSKYRNRNVDPEYPPANNYVLRDIEDLYPQDEEDNENENDEDVMNGDDDDIPIITGLPEDVSKALIALTSRATSLKSVFGRLRTVHHVYELPDGHPILVGVERREPDDPSPYLFLVWASDVDANKWKSSGRQSFSQGVDLSSKNIEGQNPKFVLGTIMIPCRTANRGRFPLNGTFFQVNEVFADEETAENPMLVRRNCFGECRIRTLYCGKTVSAITTGLTTEDIVDCFSDGFICLRAFNRTTRAPGSLPKKFHK